MPMVSVWHFIRNKYTVCYNKNKPKLVVIDGIGFIRVELDALESFILKLE